MSNKNLIIHGDFDPVIISDIYYAYQAHLAGTVDKITFAIPVNTVAEEKRPYFLEKKEMIEICLNEFAESGYPEREHKKRIDFVKRCKTIPCEKKENLVMPAIQEVKKRYPKDRIYLEIKQSQLQGLKNHPDALEFLEKYNFIVIPDLLEKVEYTIMNDSFLRGNIDLCISNMIFLLKIDRYTAMNSQSVRENFKNYRRWVTPGVEEYILNNHFYE